ncbi:MAG: hypothetical protein GX643_11455 [Acidimicrobiales bacterium]|nr:hypothetical protein [Acidimicrobiales bacterium]
MLLVRKVLPWSLLLLVTILPVVGGLVQRQRDGWYPESDDATIVLLADDTLRGDPPLVGMISTGGAHLSDPELHHPGPLELYLVSPVTTLLGPDLGAGLAATLIATGSVAALVAGLYAIGGRGLATGGFVTAALILWGIGGDAPTSVWNPYVVLMPFASFLVLSAAAVAGRRWALAGAVAFGSFVAQTHLSYAGLVGLVVIWLAGTTAWSLLRRRRRVGAPEAVALMVGIVLWLPPLIDQARGEPGNLGQIWRSFTGGGSATVGLAGVAELGRVVGLPIGGMRPRGELIRVLGGPSVVGLMALVVVSAALGALVLAAAIRLRPGSVQSLGVAGTAADVVAVGSTAAVALLAGVLTASRIPLSEGIQYQYYGLWMWPLAGVTWTLLAWSAWHLLPTRRRERVVAVVGRSWAPLLAGVAVLVTSTLPRPGTWEPWSVHRRIAGDLATQVSGADVTGHGAVLVRFRGATPYLSTGSAVVTAIAASGAEVFVDPGAPTPVFPWREGRRYTDQAIGREVWVVGGPDRHPDVPAGADLIATVATLDDATASAVDRRWSDARTRVAGGVERGPRDTSGPADVDRVVQALADPVAALDSGDLVGLVARGLVSVPGMSADELFRLERMRSLAGEGSVSLYLVTAEQRR